MRGWQEASAQNSSRNPVLITELGTAPESVLSSRQALVSRAPHPRHHGHRDNNKDGDGDNETDGGIYTQKGHLGSGVCLSLYFTTLHTVVRRLAAQLGRSMADALFLPPRNADKRHKTIPNMS